MCLIYIYITHYPHKACTLKPIWPFGLISWTWTKISLVCLLSNSALTNIAYYSLSSLPLSINHIIPSLKDKSGCQEDYLLSLIESWNSELLQSINLQLTWKSQICMMKDWKRGNILTWNRFLEFIYICT